MEVKMAETETKKSSNKTIVIILIIIIMLLLVGGGAAAFVLINNANSGESSDSEALGAGGIGYETNVGMVKPNEDLAEKLKEGTEDRIPLHFSTNAISSDGENFKCVLGNPDGARYDIYFDLYADADCTEQLYLSGLIAPGTQLEGFVSKQKIPEGTHDAVLVVTQVEDDHKTLHLQTMVVLTLNVTQGQ